jgi:uncharacterized repeat protein (TIGR02543 family)
MRKRILSMGLIVLLVLSLLPATVLAANELDGNTVTIDNISVGSLQYIIETELGTIPSMVHSLTITGTGTLDSDDITYLNGMGNLEVLNVAETITVGNVGDNFFYDRDNLISVNFPATGFGRMAFAFCDNLTTVILPFTTTFGDYAFGSCHALLTVNIPSAETFGTNAFAACDNITTISLPLATTFGDYAFSGCDYLTTVSLPAATTFGNTAFAGCYALTNINLPSAEEFGYYAFLDCTALASVYLPAATTFGNNAFRDCNALTSISLPLAQIFDYSAFENCANLTTVSLPNATTFGDYAFRDCTALASVDLPAVITFGDNAFRNCNTLTSISLPSATTFGDDAFRSCKSLTSIGLPSATTFGDNTFKFCTALANVYLPSAATFGNFTFNSCDSLTNVSLPNVTVFGDYEFFSCNSTITMTLGNTIPSSNGTTFSDYDPETKGAIAIVPNAQLAAYDADDGNPGDGMWYGWTLEQSTYTVTFDSNGGSAVAEQTVNNGAKVIGPSNPTKSGYIFNGWYSDAGTSNLWNFDTDTVLADMTLYADWIVNNSGGASTTGGTTIQTGSITLTLTDSSGNPLAYYPVELHSTVISGTTDGNGQVTFTDVTLEDHELVIFDREGTELGTIYLTMSESNTNSTSINGTTVLINFNESAVSVSIEIAVEGTELVVETASVNDNPKTGEADLAYYIGSGSYKVDVIPYICLIFTALLIGGLFVVRRQGVQHNLKK